MSETSLNERIKRKVGRAVKTSRQVLRNLATSERQPARAMFVFGAQRSGTTITGKVLGRSSHIISYLEGNPHAFDGMVLKDDATIVKLVEDSPFPYVLFKPICESHRAAELLSLFPGSKAIWIFRNFRDMANSGVKKWGHGRRNLKDLAEGNLEAASWRAGGLTPEKLAFVRKFYHDEMIPHAAFSVLWYIRNGLYFDLKFHEHPDILLVKYEDLVTQPTVYFKRAFDFIDCPFEEKFVEDIFDTSIGKHPFPEIPEEILARCEELQHKLERVYASRAENTGITERRD